MATPNYEFYEQGKHRWMTWNHRRAKVTEVAMTRVLSDFEAITRKRPRSIAANTDTMTAIIRAMAPERKVSAVLDPYDGPEGIYFNHHVRVRHAPDLPPGLTVIHGYERSRRRRAAR